MYDVIVIGAGPAGSITALLCKTYGLKTLLIEKKKMPRVKPCGGAVSQKALDLLKSINISIPLDLIQKKVVGIRIHKPNGKVITIDAGHTISILVLRKDFDFFLVKQALVKGVELIENCEVKDIVINENASVYTENGDLYKAKVVVGADGVNGCVAKRVGIRKKWDPETSGICLEAEPTVKNEIIEDFFGEKKYLEIYFGIIFGGYAWVFPKNNKLSIGIGGQRNRIKKLGQTFRKFCKGFPFIDHRNMKILGHLIPAGGVKRQVVSKNVLLVGDAAGYVDTLIGEGIYYAIRSGIIAAQTISEAIVDNNFSEKDLLKYQDRCWDAFGSDLKVSLKFSLRLHSHLNFYLSIIENDKKCQKLFLEVVEGKKTYKQFCQKLYLRSLLSIIKIAINRFRG